MNICSVCEKKFQKPRHLRLHFARNHVDKSKWDSVCELCDRVYADDEILRRHMKNHDKIKTKSPCPMNGCKKLFIRKSFLDKHVSIAHADHAEQNYTEAASSSKKTYVCKEKDCDASFAKHHMLTEHSYVHTKILPFKCSHCDKRFPNMGHKNRHEKVHKGYPCTECGEIQRTWTGLLTHTARFHPKEYKCEDCDRKFHTPCRLKIHSTIHADERQVYQCGKCDRNFTRKHALHVHIKVVHAGMKQFKCTFEECGKSYAHRHSLHNHTKKCHNGEGPPIRKIRSDKLDVVSRIIGIDTKQFDILIKASEIG